jgi:hypothetical protein
LGGGGDGTLEVIAVVVAGGGGSRLVARVCCLLLMVVVVIIGLGGGGVPIPAAVLAPPPVSLTGAGGGGVVVGGAAAVVVVVGFGVVVGTQQSSGEVEPSSEKAPFWQEVQVSLPSEALNVAFGQMVHWPRKPSYPGGHGSAIHFLSHVFSESDMLKKRPHPPTIAHEASTCPVVRVMGWDTAWSSRLLLCWLTVEKVLDWTPKVLVSPPCTTACVRSSAWRLVMRL